MLFPEFKLDVVSRSALSRIPDLSSHSIRTTEVDAYLLGRDSLQTGFRHVRLIKESIPHIGKETRPVRTTEIGSTLQLRERIEILPHGIEVDVRCHVLVHVLREVHVDAQEFDTILEQGVGGRLGFQRGKEVVEPFEVFRVSADPDEFDSAEALGPVGSAAQVPDILQDRGPGGDADSGADEDGDLIAEDVFGWCAVGAVDADFGHCLPVLEGDLVHSHGVEAIKVFRLRRTAT